MSRHRFRQDRLNWRRRPPRQQLGPTEQPSGAVVVVSEASLMSGRHRDQTSGPHNELWKPERRLGFFKLLTRQRADDAFRIITPSASLFGNAREIKIAGGLRGGDGDLRDDHEAIVGACGYHPWTGKSVSGTSPSGSIWAPEKLDLVRHLLKRPEIERIIDFDRPRSAGRRYQPDGKESAKRRFHRSDFTRSFDVRNGWEADVACFQENQASMASRS